MGGDRRSWSGRPALQLMGRQVMASRGNASGPSEPRRETRGAWGCNTGRPGLELGQGQEEV